MPRGISGLWPVLALSVALLAGLTGALARPAHAEPRTDETFDHGQHRAHLDPCTRCHRMSAATGWLQRRPMYHDACDAPGCHADAYASPRAFRGGLAPLCQRCHADFARGVFAFPPHRGDPDRGLPTRFDIPRFDHADHQRDGARGCAQCHVERRADAAPGPAPEFGPVGHETCGQSICHGERVAPRMADCAGCHRLLDAPRPPRGTAVAEPYRVEFGFTHVAHRTAAPDAPCGSCHADPGAGPGAPVPRPAMAACATCHDGAVAFATTGTRCGRCHARDEIPHGR